MTIGLTNAARGLSNEQVLIYRVATKFEGGGYARYDLEMGKPIRRLAELLAKVSGGSRGGVGGLSAAYSALVNTYSKMLINYNLHTHTTAPGYYPGTSNKHVHDIGTDNSPVPIVITGSHTHAGGNASEESSHTHSVTIKMHTHDLAHTHTVSGAGTGTGLSGLVVQHLDNAGGVSTAFASGAGSAHSHTTADTGSENSHTHGMYSSTQEEYGTGHIHYSGAPYVEPA